MLHHPRWEDDGVLADRVRSSLGPLLKRLDQPRGHVASTRQAVTLHGHVTDVEAKAEIEEAARSVPGVTGVSSHLVVGLAAGESTPSAGRRGRRSPLLLRLERTARDCGFVSRAEARYALRGLLSVFAAQLPYAVRKRFLEHLPADVHELATSVHWLTPEICDLTSEHDLAQTAALAMLTDRRHADRLLRAVLPILRDHAPGDAARVASALPTEIRALWGDVSSRRSSAIGRDRLQQAVEGLAVPVSAVMTRELVTASPHSSLFEAFELMASNRVHHLPVVRRDGRCIALLDAVSVAERLPEAWVTRGGVALQRFGAVGPLSVLPDVSLSHAAVSMNAAGVDACCVVDVHGRLVGLVTARDVVAAVARAADHG